MPANPRILKVDIMSTQGHREQAPPGLLQWLQGSAQGAFTFLSFGLAPAPAATADNDLIYS